MTYLWVYREIEQTNEILYTTFLTEEQAKDTFGGKFSYHKFNGIMPQQGEKKNESSFIGHDNVIRYVSTCRFRWIPRWIFNRTKL